MDVQSNWWESFFQGVAVDMWLQAVSPGHTRHEAAFIAAALGAAPGAQLLDVPCGGGRLSIALASRGYRMTAVDLSAEFLDHARAADAAGTVAWEKRDMRDLPWPARFDGAFCAGNSFGYLDDDENAAFLRSVGAALKPGARFLLDCGTVLESLLVNLTERFWAKTGDVYLLKTSDYDHARGRINSEYAFVSGRTIETRRASYRAYSFRQIAELFEQSGFVVESADAWKRTGAVNPYADDAPLATEPYKVGAPSLLLTARRT